MAQLSLDTLLGVVAGNVQQIEQLKPVVQENFRKQELMSGDQAQLLEQIGSDKAIVEQAARTADLKAQAATMRAANAAGVDPSASSDFIVQTMSKLANSNREVEQDVLELKKRSETRFLDAPVDWIVNNMFGGIDRAAEEVKNSSGVSKMYSEQLGVVNNAIQQTAQTNLALRESVTTASADASARVLANEARARSIQAAIDGLKYNSQGIQAVLDMSSAQLSTLFSAKSAQNAQEQMGIAYQHLALDRERFNWQQQERKLMLEAKNESKEIDDYTLELVNASRASRGAPLIPAGSSQAKFALAQLKSDKAGTSEISYDLQNGGRIKQTDTPMIGASPAESAEVLQSFRHSSNLPEIQKQTMSVIQEAQAALTKAGVTNPGLAKDPAARNNFINSYVSEKMKRDYQIVRNEGSNLMNVGELSSYFGLKAIQGTPVVEKVLAPAAKLGQPLDNPAVVISLVTKAVQDGVLTTSQAAGLATVYQGASLINQQARGFAKFGIQLPGGGKEYNVQTETRGPVINVADPTQLTRHISKTLALKTIYGIGKQPEDRGAAVKKFMEGTK